VETWKVVVLKKYKTVEASSQRLDNMD